MGSHSDLDFIHTFVPAQQAGLATLLLLHGTGGDESDLVPLGRALAPGCGILSPRGKVLENGMPRYFRRLAEGVFDHEDLVFRTEELARFVRKAAETYAFDVSNVWAVGYSNGANIAASVLLLRPEVLAGAVLLHAQVPLEPASLPSLSGRPVFLGGGRLDMVVPPEETDRLASLLAEFGASVTLHWEQSGHSLSRTEIDAARAWLAHELTTMIE